MSIRIRSIAEDEIETYLDTLTTAFLERRDVPRIAAELREMWDLDRTWAAFDGDRMCGTFRSWATEVTVPGGTTLPATAVSGVTVLPTHRRRGILRSMTAVEHEAARGRDEAVAMLYASEYPIYGRFGYGPATRQATWSLDTHSAAFHGDSSTGRVDLMAPSASARDAIRGVFEGWRVGQAGEIRRREWDWDFDLGLRSEFWGDDWKGFLAVHRGAAGEIDGYARYRSESKWEQRQPRNVLRIDELHALTEEAYRDLWRFLSEVDWVATVHAERRSPSERLPWLLTNARAATIVEQGDALWVCVLDVERALEARTYEGEGSLVLEIVDPSADGTGQGRSRVLLEAGPDGSRCTTTDRAPDLTFARRALGAAYLGGTLLTDAAQASGGIDEHRPGAAAEAERLFRTIREPWCSSFF